MYIKFVDNGKVYKVTGERRQFWLFDKDGEPGRAVKGSDSYVLLDSGKVETAVAYHTDVEVRDEKSDLETILEELEDEEV